jgi:hypothetical protein
MVSINYVKLGSYVFTLIGAHFALEWAHMVHLQGVTYHARPNQATVTWVVDDSISAPISKGLQELLEIIPTSLSGSICFRITKTLQACENHIPDKTAGWFTKRRQFQALNSCIAHMEL